MSHAIDARRNAGAGGAARSAPGLFPAHARRAGPDSVRRGRYRAARHGRACGRGGGCGRQSGRCDGRQYAAHPCRWRTRRGRGRRAAGVTALAHVSAIGADANGQAAYARSKGEGETAVRQAFPNATILRPSIVFGREDQFVNRFAGMVSAPVVPILRAGVKFQPVFAGDVGEAIAAALRHPEAHGGRTYELGGPDVISMGELVRWIAQTLGRKPNFIELPDFAGALLARLPGSPISWDQWLMLQQDNVAGRWHAGPGRTGRHARAASRRCAGVSGPFPQGGPLRTADRDAGGLNRPATNVFVVSLNAPSPYGGGAFSWGRM
ncbi:NADH dehydrogenase [ubiquinone] 1 alpha subcomplex subunit 9 [Schistosoma japonicum]|uniref:NADH dehydrogenase [ubiquinone] 1 alpha subcomplex subunit 9, mitochondrial n=1 Tax=Schistosoma japonicum TaxID=6182 RepID=A0A4Z2CKT6_SCHJA|nr:NADH dehydrogenase [ubiquinone] 1 alpha subcomplex subunit 9 [Schistosoma japonicum]